MCDMGLLTLVIIAVVILAIIGLGIGTFYSGILQGVEKIGNNDAVKDAAGDTGEVATNMTHKSASN